MFGWNRSKHLEYVQCVGPISGMHKFFQKSGDHLKILGIRRVI